MPCTAALLLAVVPVLAGAHTSARLLHCTTPTWNMSIRVIVIAVAAHSHSKLIVVAASTCTSMHVRSTYAALTILHITQQACCVRVQYSSAYVRHAAPQQGTYSATARSNTHIVVALATTMRVLLRGGKRGAGRPVYREHSDRIGSTYVLLYSGTCATI